MEQDKNKTPKYIGVCGGCVHNLKILNGTDIAETAEMPRSGLSETAADNLH